MAKIHKGLSRKLTTPKDLDELFDRIDFLSKFLITNYSIGGVRRYWNLQDQLRTLENNLKISEPKEDFTEYLDLNELADLASHSSRRR